MRKILLSLFVVNILLSFFIFFDLENNSLNDKIFRSGEGNSVTLRIGKDITQLDRNQTIDTIQQITEKYQADLIFKVFHNSPGEKKNITKYVFFKDSDGLFKSIRTDGRVLGDYDRGKKYLSSTLVEKKTDEQRIGRILVLDPEVKFKISTFESLKDEKYVLSGFYTFNLERDKIDAFIKDMKAELQIDVERSGNLGNAIMNLPPILKIIPMTIVMLLTALVVAYDLISRFKDIAIKKLNGYSGLRLKLEYLRNIGTTYLIASIISYIILGLICIFEANILYVELLLKSIIVYIFLFLLISLILFLPLRYMENIVISQGIKNMKPVRLIGRIGLVFKMIFTAILLGLFMYALKLYVPVLNFYSDNLKKWEDTVHYAQVSLSYDEDNNNFEDTIWRMVQNKKLYLYANRQGGLQIVVNEEFKSEQEDKKTRDFENAYYNSIEINTNYLRKHPVFDDKGKKVIIDDNDNINYILVPVKYATMEEEITRTVEMNLYSLHDMPKEFQEGRLKEQKALHESAPEIFDKEFGEVRIILIKNNQEYFTYDLFNHPETANMVKDRIVIVNNDRAGLHFDISNNGGYLIKVKNHEEPFLSISDKVQELGLGAYYNQAYSIYGYVASEIDLYLETLLEIGVIFGIASITIALLVVYSVMTYMEKNKLDNCVKLLNGYGFLERHGRKLCSVILFYVPFLPVLIIVRKSGEEMMAIGMLLCGAVLFELLASLVLIRVYEQRNIKDMLKGN